MDTLIIKVIKTIEKYRMIQRGDKIIVAVSGGPDSICLLDILNSIKKNYHLSLIVAHVDHGIRKEESEEEARFVSLKSFHMHLPFEQRSVSIPALAQEKGLSMEQAGRRVRYQFFKELLCKYQAQVIALGHHADDQVETILMRLIRGSGLHGLRGIPARRDSFIRPLIECTKKEIEAYCHRRNISFCIDSSNRELNYLRNRIRNQLIPLLIKQYNPAIENQLLRLQSIVQNHLDFFEQEIQQYYLAVIKKENLSEIVLDCQKIITWPVALQRGVIRRALRHFRKHLADIQFSHVESIRLLCREDRGEKYLDLPGEIRIRKSYHSLEISTTRYLKKSGEEKTVDEWEYELPVLQDVRFPLLGVEFTMKSCQNSPSIRKQCMTNKEKDRVCVDYDKLVLPLKIRNRRPGDRFKPLNVSYFKSVKSYFIDRKVRYCDRGKIALVADSAGRIVWVVDYQLDDRFKITDQTTKILQIHKKMI